LNEHGKALHPLHVRGNEKLYDPGLAAGLDFGATPSPSSQRLRVRHELRSTSAIADGRSST
jgi:hypothetical protein